MQHVAERKGLLDEAQQGIRQLLLAADPSSTRPVLSRYHHTTPWGLSVLPAPNHLTDDMVRGGAGRKG